MNKTEQKYYQSLIALLLSFALLLTVVMAVGLQRSKEAHELQCNSSNKEESSIDKKTVVQKNKC